MTYPRFQRSRDFKWLRQTASLACNSTSWANMPTIATHTLAAQVGDTLEAVFGAYHDGVAVALHLDAVTEVGGTPTNSFATGAAAPTSTTGVGVGGWFCRSGADGNTSGSCFYTVVSGDLSATGQVTVRMRYRTSSGSAKTLDVTGGNIFFGVRNLGPVDPN